MEIYKMDDILWMKWDERTFSYEPCDSDDPDAEPFEWDEDASEWVYIGEGE
jgi:hypothetical protein